MDELTWPQTRWAITAFVAATAAVWAAELGSAAVGGDPPEGRVPGARRRILAALLGLTAVPIPLTVWLIPDTPDEGPVVGLLALFLILNQLAGVLTLRGVIAAWRRAEEPPPDPADGSPAVPPVTPPPAPSEPSP